MTEKKARKAGELSEDPVRLAQVAGGEGAGRGCEEEIPTTITEI